MTLIGIKAQIDGKTVVFHPNDVEFIYSPPMTDEEFQAAMAASEGYYTVEDGEIVKVGEGRD